MKAVAITPAQRRFFFSVPERKNGERTATGGRPPTRKRVKRAKDEWAAVRQLDTVLNRSYIYFEIWWMSKCKYKIMEGSFAALWKPLEAEFWLNSTRLCASPSSKVMQIYANLIFFFNACSTSVGRKIVSNKMSIFSIFPNVRQMLGRVFAEFRQWFNNLMNVVFTFWCNYTFHFS